MIHRILDTVSQAASTIVTYSSDIMFPLHYACMSMSCLVNIVQQLIELSPLGADTANIMTLFQATPLHIVCYLNESPSEMIRLLIQSGLEALSMIDFQGRIPLYYLLSHRP